MKAKSLSLINFYYVLSISVLTAVIALSFHYFYQSGIINVSSVSTVLNASTIIEGLSQSQTVPKIGKMVATEQVGEAVNELNALQNTVSKINNVASHESFEKLNDQILAMRKELSGVTAKGQVEGTTTTLENGVVEFRQFVKTNNWRTLSRMADAMGQYLEAGQKHSKAYYGRENLMTLKSRLVRDLRAMRQITTSSVLSAVDKATVIGKLDAIKNNLITIDQYMDRLGNSERGIKVLEQAYTNWNRSVSPVIALKKISLEKNSGKLVLFFMSLLALMVTLSALGLVCYSKAKAKLISEVESHIIQTLKESIIPKDNSAISGSPEFQKNIESLKEYIHRRMNFGITFQETLPFPAMLLDKNLKLIWANNLFFEQWKISKDVNSAITWDYLQKNTNLGEHDPIISALQEGISGIYQIQVREDDGVINSYEMYVCPVEEDGTRKIMAFFYALASVEEGLVNHTRCLMGPLNRTLDALIQGSYTKEFKEGIVKDFEIAGISEVNDKFLKYSEQISQQRMGLLTEIEKLETSLFDQHKMNEDAQRILGEVESAQQDFKLAVQEIKERIVILVEAKNNFMGLGQRMASLFEMLVEKGKRHSSSFKELYQGQQEILKIFASMTTLKQEFKDYREKIEESKMAIITQLKSPSVSPEQIEKIRNDMKNLDATSKNFSKLLTTFDVTLSKYELVSQNVATFDSDFVARDIMQMKDDAKPQIASLQKMVGSATVGEESIIEPLKNLLNLYKDSRARITNVRDLLKDHKETSLDQQPLS